ncbi:MAG: hypothetical protein MZV70_29325 [Desulfobacterales bacterium]|nr:hypothetical protein [Desulfobacterales bacterium]
MVFDNNFVTTAICCSSRASIFTGLHERSNGIADFATHIHAADRPNTYYNLLRHGLPYGFRREVRVGTEMPSGDFDYWRGFPGQGKSENMRDGKPIHMTQILTEDTLGSGHQQNGSAVLLLAEPGSACRRSGVAPVHPGNRSRRAV